MNPPNYPPQYNPMQPPQSPGYPQQPPAYPQQQAPAPMQQPPAYPQTNPQQQIHAPAPMQQPHNPHHRVDARVAGGHQAKMRLASRNSGLRINPSDVRSLRFGKDTVNMPIAILPARDASLVPGDPSFDLSVVPYRIQDTDLNAANGQLTWSSWFQLVRAHRFLGTKGVSFISPVSLPPFDANGMERPAHEVSDPIVDMLNVARNDSRFEHLTRKPTVMPPGAKRMPNEVLRYPSQLVAYNVMAYVHMTQRYEVFLGLSSATAHDFVTTQLDWAALANVASRDPKWPAYHLGDVTDPMNLLWGFAIERATMPSSGGGDGRSGGKTAALTFSQEGKHGSPLFAPAPWQATPEILKARYDLCSTSIWCIPTYQEIVDFCVSDMSFPYELIQMACGAMANIAPRPNATFGAAHTGFPGMPGGYNAPMMPPQQAQPPGYPQAQPPAYQPPQQQAQPPGYPQAQPPAYQPPPQQAQPPGYPQAQPPAYQPPPQQAQPPGYPQAQPPAYQPPPQQAQPPAYQPPPQQAQPPAYQPPPQQAQPPAYQPPPQQAQPPAYQPPPQQAQPPAAVAPPQARFEVHNEAEAFQHPGAQQQYAQPPAPTQQPQHTAAAPAASTPGLSPEEREELAALTQRATTDPASMVPADYSRMAQLNQKSTGQ